MTQNTIAISTAMQGSFELLRLRTLMSIASEWMWQTDHQLQVSWLSRGALNKTGLLSQHLLGKALWESEHIVPAFNEQWSKLQQSMLSLEIFQDFVMCYVNASGQLMCLSLSGAPIFSDAGQFLGYAGLAINLTEYQKQGRGVLRLLSSDPLTGGANWKTMEEAFERGLVVARRKGKSLGFIMIRLPDLNQLIKDHSFSDTIKLMQTVSKLLEQNIRKGDVVCRLNINEFGIVLNEIAQASDLVRILDKIGRAFDGVLPLGDTQVNIRIQTAHIQAPELGDQLEILINISRSMLDKENALEESHPSESNLAT